MAVLPSGSSVAKHRGRVMHVASGSRNNSSSSDGPHHLTLDHLAFILLPPSSKYCIPARHVL